MQAVFNARTIDELRPLPTAVRWRVSRQRTIDRIYPTMNFVVPLIESRLPREMSRMVLHGRSILLCSQCWKPPVSILRDASWSQLCWWIRMRHIFLREHRLYRRPFLPAVVSAEILAEAASQLFPGRTLTEIHDLDLLAGHTFVSDALVSLEARITQEGAASCRCELALNPGVGNATRLVTMKATFADKPLPRETIAVREPGFGWIPFQYPDDWAVFYHGPAFRTYREFAFQHDGGLCPARGPELMKMAGDRAAAIHWMTPFGLARRSHDGLRKLCLFHAGRQSGHPCGVSTGYGFTPSLCAGEVCMLRLFIRRIEETGTSYDFQLIGKDGSVYFTAEGFDMICIKDDGKQ